MKKRYILMTIDKNLKYDGYERYYYKLFDDYFKLQKHLLQYWYIEKNKYVIFEETDLNRDYSINNIKSGPRI